SRNWLWLLPPLMVLWANLHLGWAYGLLLLGLYAVSINYEHWRLHQAKDVRFVWLLLGACILATFVSPFPGRLLLYPITNYFIENSGMAIISEWQSPNFHSIFYAQLAASILFLVAIGVFRSGNLFLALTALAFSFLALSSIRNQPLFA